MGKPLYLSYDGDSCGKKVGRAIIANDEVALREISAKIDLGHEIVNHWVAEHGGKVISGGGDEGSFKLPEESIHDIEQLRKDYHFATGITISVGVGNSLSEAGRSLLAAKFRGKDQVAYYDEKVEKDISTARKRVKKGKATQEEYKLAEAYLEKAEDNMADEQKDCQYCEQTDGVDPDHCKYCHDADAKENEEECPYCKEGDAAQAEGDCPYCKDSPADADECPYCKDDAASGPKDPEVASMDDNAAQQNTKIQSPDSNNASAPAGSDEEKQQYNEMGMNPPVIGKPEMGDKSPAGMGEASPMFDGAPVENEGEKGNEEAQGKEVNTEEGAHSKEALQAIAQQIEGETVDGKPEDKEVANQIDDADLGGTSMEGNISRPENFESGTPGDMGIDAAHEGSEGSEASDEDPNLSDVLKEGLDNNADDIQKEKVRAIVGQALESFKASKDFLERAKEQSPELYASSIAMLRAMIEMAKMLGLGEGNVEAEGQPEENEWKDPFPKHPDQGGEMKPGHAAPQEDAAQAPQQ